MDTTPPTTTTTWPTLRIPTSSQIRSLVSNWRGSLRFGHLALLAIFGLFVFWLSWNWNDFFPFSGCFHRFWVIEYDEVTKKGNFLKYASAMLMIKNTEELRVSEDKQEGGKLCFSDLHCSLSACCVPSPHDRGPSWICSLTNIGFVIHCISDTLNHSSHRNWFPPEQILDKQVAVVLLLLSVKC